MRTLQILNGDPWHAGIVSKLITGIVVGIVLATVNDIYWSKQRKETQYQAMIEIKIESYSELSSAYTQWIAHHNAIVALNNKYPGNVEWNADDKRAKAQYESEIAQGLAVIAGASAKLNVIVPGSDSKLKAITALMAALNSNDMSPIKPDDKIIQTMSDAFKFLARDIKKDIVD